ncbi:MAG: PLP-dependent aminotransferase family protein [Bacilli bacterium]|nr:PLP-dependent aminotransferase family protein [Bacilli bacterium]MBN2696439.1 PLP-dependent aminotransferase family protein [Bacilli bacterium]
MITLFFDKNAKEPLYEQLYAHIKEAILSRQLPPDEKMPSKRELAFHLKVSVQTVETAYQQLMAEGYIRSKPKSGYFVERIEASPLRKIGPKSTGNVVSKSDVTIKVDFRTDVIDHEHFPYLQWARLEKTIILDEIKSSINSQSTFGYLPLREEIAKYLYQYRGISANPNNIMIGSGTDHLLMVLRFLFPGSLKIAIENPVYLKLVRLYQALGVEVISTGLDESGFMVKEILEKAIDLVHVTPSHQFPSGRVMPIARRIEVLNWANQSQRRYVIEDDYDSEFRFSGNPIPAMKSLDYSENVIYMNSFTKSVAPSLRISFMVLPEELADNARSQLDFLACPVALLGQVALSQFLANGMFERHLNKMKMIYKSRRDKLIELIRNTWMREKFDISGYEAGLHFLLVAKEAVDEHELVSLAKTNGIRIRGMNEYIVREIFDAKATIVMGYSDLSDHAMKTGIATLEQAWRPLFYHE